MPVVLKIKFGAELHRVLLEEANLTFDAVCDAITGVHHPDGIVIKYLDEDNDLCTLCPSSFSDFWSHATEQKGKKVLKVEVFDAPQRKSCSLPGAPPASASQDSASLVNDQENPLASLIQMGVQFMKGFGKGGLGAGSGCGWHGDHYGGGHHQFRLRMLKFGLAQLYKNDLLDATSFSALLVNLLPQLTTFVAEHPEKVNRKLGEKMADIQSLLEDLRHLVAGTQGMEHCEAALSAWRDQQVTASKALTQLLTALMALPFDTQVSFAQALYSRQEHTLNSAIQGGLDHRPWIPAVPLLHVGITCDGCNASPINGVRFKCTSCPDYDLCGTCFIKKSSIHTGECNSHDFTATVFPDSFAPWMAMCKGKGKGKGKSKGKGKGKGWCWWKGCSEMQQEARPCAREGCQFASTWHPTHCCVGCALGGTHGMRCTRQLFKATSTEDSVETEEKESSFDMTFPVEVGDGRCLTISWNHGDDAQRVAQMFAQQHGILPDEISTIEAFVQQACVLQAAVPASSADETKPECEEAAGAESNASDPDNDALLKQATLLAEAGLGDVEVLLALLRSHDGSVQRTVEELLNNQTQ